MAQKDLINYTAEAFSLPANLAYLAIATLSTISVGVLDIVSIAPIPWESVLFTGAGLEMIYLGMMPRNAKFRQAVQARRYEELEQVERQTKLLDLMNRISLPSQERYLRLNERKQHIAELIGRREGTSRYFIDKQLNKLDRLEHNYLELLQEIERYDEHLQGNVQERLNQQLTQIRSELNQQLSPKVKKYYEKRLELLNKRKEQFKGVEEHRQLAQIQLDTIDDTINYLIDQTLSLQNPDELSTIIDQVIEEAEAHHQSAQELEDFFSEADYEILEDQQTAPPRQSSANAS
jgi:hypothetical protein